MQDDVALEALTEIRAHERECLLRAQLIQQQLERIERQVWGIYVALVLAVALPIYLGH
jgi:hypothetical protein